MATNWKLVPAAEEAVEVPGVHELCGLPVWTQGRTALFDLMRAGVPKGKLIELHSVNAEISMQVRNEPDYRALMTLNPTNIMDGEGVRRMVALKYGQLFERISGSDLVTELASLAADESWSVYLLGASEEVSEKAATKLLELNPQLVLERWSPPFERDAKGAPTARVSATVSDEILTRIAKARPTVLIACLGSPKQELWMKQHEAELVAAGVRVVMGAGGSLDFLAGKTRRAPKGVSGMGLEWLWRLAHEPRARFGRMATRLPRFVVHGLTDALAHRWRKAG